MNLDHDKNFTSFEEPIRSVIFSVTELERHGESLAHAQAVTKSAKHGKQIDARTRDNSRVLEQAYLELLKAAQEKRSITSAAEWLIDNFHIVRAQLGDIHDHLPPAFYRELPKIADGPLKGFPRVYGIAWAFAAHTDSRFDSQLLKRFLTSYQKVQPLTIGELWAVSTTLRLVLIENLRRLSARIVGSQSARKEADKISDELLGLSDGPLRTPEQIIASMDAMPFVPAFAVQLLQRLRFQEAKIDPILSWLDGRLTRENVTPDQLVSAEHSSQTGANATVRNIITSFRLMSAFNWQSFFEDVSLVEQNLKQHPLYPQMDFATRDRYRHGLEELARYSPYSELQISKVVLELSKSATEKDQESKAVDLGYFLISTGRATLEPEIKFRPPPRLRILRWYLRNATALYLGTIFALTLLAVAIPTSFAIANGVGFFALMVLVTAGVFPAFEIGLALVNRFSMAVLGPRHLPRFDLEAGVPEHLRTFVVVPTMLSQAAKIDAQVEQLEIHYLSNSEGFLHFALLTDWLDSKAEVSAADWTLSDRARSRIAALNEKYGKLSDGSARFYLFHRRRLFNESEGKWIGWERKRGKLHEFNRLLRGADETSFLFPPDNPGLPPANVKYVITLDADTKLPNGAAAQLVGTLAHPLNRARYSATRDRIVSGYGILQPRVTPSLPSTHSSSVFQTLTSGPSGVDPYASAVSDVYQDLFEEGSYVGKGIYDVDAFETSLAGKIPENALLSHDLFEGNYARCGFLSDVEFFEDFPSHSGVAASRTHRWIRGDWQLVPFIFGRLARKAGRIRFINRWKMIDNLRRSLTPAMTIVTLVAGLAIRNSQPVAWLFLFLIGLSHSTLIQLISDIIPRRRNISFAQHLKVVVQDFGLSFQRLMMTITLLAYQGAQAIDSIVRANYRLYVSRKNLLEWTTADQAQAAASLSLSSFVRSMKSAVAVAGLGLLIILIFNRSEVFLYLPFFFLWAASPLLARELSSPPKERLTKPLATEDIQLLNSTARKIWLFFATFVTKEENYLPPDNFQEDPVAVVAHRSSPTNFGLYLLSVLAARDFGWIGTIEMANRLTETLRSMQNLPRYQGHFFNWYETTGARALDPKYISSVDNGNLAGHLIAVAEGCTEALHRPISKSGFNRGALQTLLLLEKSLARLKQIAPEDLKVQEIRLVKFETISRLLLIPDHLLENRARHWHSLKFNAEKLVEDALAIATALPGAESHETLVWARALQNDILSSVADFSMLAHWASLEINDDDFRYRFELEVPLKDLANHCESLLEDLKRSTTYKPSEILITALETSVAQGRRLTEEIQSIYKLCHQLVQEMDFRLLYDPAKKLFSIGYRVADNELDASYYDLLASEARLTSFIAIAKGDVPANHWFYLGRGLTLVDNSVALVSWSGSMFEYLMPSLVMLFPPGSLIDKTCRLIVKRQIQYGQEQNVPWGISESAYNQRDLQLTYQYTNFGVPDLGLKRGLGADVVVAPYASFLAAMYEPQEAVANLLRLRDLGAEGLYGFYEAVDFTPTRLPEGKTEAVVKTYMAHHQGMSLISIINIFKDGLMQNRFHAEPAVQAAQLLLQERTPRNVGVTKPSRESFLQALVREETETVSRSYHTVNRPIPTTQVLANDEYAVMVTSSGSGYSRYRDVAINRWREDVTKDNWGNYFYIRDRESAKVWSATYQPTCTESESYEVTFADDRAKFARFDDGISTELEVLVSPEHNVEIRNLCLTNKSEKSRTIQVTSFFEIALAPQGADVAHPAFSNLFVQTEIIQELNAMIATRRARSAKDKPSWLAQVVLTDRHAVGALEYESDRSKFIGRGKTSRNPDSVSNGKKLSNTAGAVLDPIMSLRTTVELEPGSSSRLAYGTIAADTREELLRLVEQFQLKTTLDRATSLAWTQAQVKLHYLNIEADEAHLFQRLATRLVFSDSSLRPSSDFLKLNSKDVTGLWAHGISGDFPIVLLRIDDIDDRAMVRQLLKAHEYLGAKHLKFDLVILNEKANSYAQELQDTLNSMVHAATVMSQSAIPNSRGKVFILRSDLLSEQDRLVIYASARAILTARQGNLAEQVQRGRPKNDYPIEARRALLPAPKSAGTQTQSRNLPVPDLDFFNGIGGFSKDASEYVIVQTGDVTPPAPWINVISNSDFGFQVSESGSGFTWSMNSRENQISPWSNDPVCDPSGEVIYLRDAESGKVWTPTALPIRIPDSTYLTKHGQGYSSFEHLSQGIHSELTQFLDPIEPVKISKLVLENRSRGLRRISVTGYVEFVLGFSRATMAPTTVTEYDTISGAIFASNSRSDEYGSRVSFATFREASRSWSGDRTEFIGRNGTTEAPAALYRKAPLSGAVGAGFDPCAALETEITLAPGESKEIVFLLGQAAHRRQAQDIIAKFRGGTAHPAVEPNEILKNVRANWAKTLGKIQVTTPDKSMDVMLNRWLLYQTLACRFWARAAFYQVGGAFGFRDQLQDMLALVTSQPEMAKEHILKAAARQFPEGDVQHWWHPPFGRGVRTHFSDDLVWLPYTVSQYLKVTKDQSILHARVPFIEGPLLRADQEDSYYTPSISHFDASLFEHCARALDKSLIVGAHGLPLIGAGDWNDGMNRVGHDGKGESVWLAWFLFTNLNEFAKVADTLGETERAQIWRAHALNLQEAIETEAWDGEWYRRAYFDDGTPLGSATGAECQIDSLSQTWAVISGAGNPERTQSAMNAVDRLLVKEENKMILLFTPPFDKTPNDPGYIKGYLPGVRENGGQYTHAAVWTVIAEAMQGNGKRATDLFRILNPVNHAQTENSMQKYKVEPYVLAADVYSVPPHTGRGGWTWYTGSAGWMYRAGVEYILGLRLEGDELVINPCIPNDWPGFSASFKHGQATFEIEVENPSGVSRGVANITVDGKRVDRIMLVDDGQVHHVLVAMG